MLSQAHFLCGRTRGFRSTRFILKSSEVESKSLSVCLVTPPKWRWDEAGGCVQL